MQKFMSSRSHQKSLLWLTICGSVSAFTFTRHGRVNVAVFMAGEDDFMSKLSNPFAAKESPREEPTPLSGTSFFAATIGSEPFDPTPEGLIEKAKAVIAADLGVQDPSLLDKDFLWIGPLLENPLNKIDYLAAGRFFSIRTAFPDLDYRPHDFRIDDNNSLTVRCTVRPSGVMRGQLRLRNELVEPNGKQWRGPPEAISITFDVENGKVVKMCSGFGLDRFVGNTNGLCGVMAAATVAGAPPSDWEVYPIPAVISRFFGRPVDPVNEISTFLAPFPETVMIQLVKGIISTNLAAEDPSLLSTDFSFVTSAVGPIGKIKFQESYAAQEFGGFEPVLSHFRVDPFDPYRVWVDVKPIGPGLEGPPQAFSFTFDDDGFCTRMTAGAVMDPSIGNTGGLTGPVGIKYALGEGGIDFTTRPLPVAIGRLKKTLLSPLTRIGADDYLLEGRQQEDEEAGGADLVGDDPAATRKVLADARARILEEVARKRELEKEQEARLQAQQQGEQERLRAQQQAEQDRLRARQEIERELVKREVDSRQEAAPMKKEDVSPPPMIPTPPKTLPPPGPISIETKPKVGKPKASSETFPPTQSQPAFFADAFKPLSGLTAQTKPKVGKSKAPSETFPPTQSQPAFFADAFKPLSGLTAQKTTGAKENKSNNAKGAAAAAAKRKAESEETRLAAEEQKRSAEAEKRKQAKRKAESEETRLAAEEQKRSAEAGKRKQAKLKAESEETRLAAEEQKRSAEAEKRKRVALNQKKKVEIQKKAVEEKRLLIEENRQRQAEIRKAAAEVKKLEIQQKKAAAEEVRTRKNAEVKEAVDKKQKEAQEERIAAERKINEAISKRTDAISSAFSAFQSKGYPMASKETPKKRTAPKQSKARPSFQIPKVEPTPPKTPPKLKSSSSKPRPSFQIPQFSKANESEKPKKSQPSMPQSQPSKPRPSFQIPQFPRFAEKSKTQTPQSRKSITLPQAPRPSINLPKTTKAPKGMPTIVGWRRRPNGGISGQIFGATNFKEGERVETSTIAAGEIGNGSVVTTESGSRYFLSSLSALELRAVAMKTAPVPKDFSNAKPRPTLQLTKQAKAREAKAAQAALEAASKASSAVQQKRPTFSLASLFGMEKQDEEKSQPQEKTSIPSSKTSRSPVVPNAPKGVPSIGRWKQNRDKSITGFISGSMTFSEGERITTSPIARGTIGASEVVQTSSGSKYFLQ